MDDFTQAFFVAALWSSNDESDDNGGEPMDRNYGIDDFDPKCRAALEAECAAFQRDYAEHIVGCARRCGYSDDAMAGHDFWLTRNDHGAGFWDGDWPEPAATVLTKASKAYGEVDLYIGDDGKVYAMGYESGERRGFRVAPTLVETLIEEIDGK